jgi:hypothetical protein
VAAIRYFYGQTGHPKFVAYLTRPNLEIETRAQGKKRVIAEVSAEYDRFMQSVPTTSSSLRAVSRAVSKEHFEWAVKYQVGGVNEKHS